VNPFSFETGFLRVKISFWTDFEYFSLCK
jgi:hypothetical protein